MKNSILIFMLCILVIGCSSDEDSTTPPSTSPIDFKLIIDGVQINYPNNDGGVSGYSAYKKGDHITVNASGGNLSNADSTFFLSLTFSTSGKFLYGGLRFNSYDAGMPGYNNYINFPSNYFLATDFSIDETNKKIKFKFNGKLYFDQRSLASESRDLQGDVDMMYTDQGDDPFPIVINNVEQYCRANFNATPWFARFEHTFSSFTDENPYKIEINFANSPTPGSFNFTSASTSNYVRLSKFNTTTLTYDYYNVNGQVAYSYREYHGGTKYSFIGTFSFTAVNPNNAADIIQVNDGVFRSYQIF